MWAKLSDYIVMDIKLMLKLLTIVISVLAKIVVIF